MSTAPELALPEGILLDDDLATQSASRWRTIGMVVLLATFGSFALGSWLAPISSAVVASGVIKVDSSRKKIQHPEGGVIKSIRVRDGAQVKQGDVLIDMDASKAGSVHGVVTSGQEMALATLARLQAERDEFVRIEFPPALMSRASEPQVLQTMRGQESQFVARRNARNGELSIVDQQIAALRSEINGIESQRLAKQSQLDSLLTDLKGLQALDKDGMVEKTKLRALERDIARVTGEREELMSKIASAQTAIKEKELKKFQVRKAFQEEVAAELKKVQAESNELQEREISTRRTLELTELRSPVSGTVTELKVHTVGGVIAPGETLMEIVPATDKLTIEARVQPADIDRVAVGQATGVKVHAFNTRTSPELSGTLRYVAADAAVDPRTELSYFLVRVDVDAKELARLEGHQIQPGMQADVFVRTGEKTIIEYLLQPLTDSFNKAWRER